MYVLIITAVMFFNVPSVSVHSVEFDSKNSCEIARNEWMKSANKRSTAICVEK